MAFSFLVRSSLPRARALMDFRKSFRLNPSLLASSGSLHNNNSHHLSSSTLVRFFPPRILKERESELLNKETTFGDGKWKEYDQSNKGRREDETFRWISVTSIIVVICAILASFAFEQGVEEKNERRFEEFRLKLLEQDL